MREIPVGGDKETETSVVGDEPGWTFEEVNSLIESRLEDAGSYFAGQKSAQEVADTIQNRVQVYVDENR